MPRRIAVMALVLGLVVTIASVRGQLPPLPDPGAAPNSRLTATLHDAFEAGRPAWRQEETDANVDLRAHERSNRAAHDAQGSERLEFEAGPGSYLYYSYPLPRIPLSAELRATLYVKANKPGLQLLGRVVLPGDIDPETRQPAFLMISGNNYDQVDRWQRLELAEISRDVERQARVLRAAGNGKRKVSLEGAYLERLVVNAIGGQGGAEVYLDDLTVAPVPEGAVVVEAEGGSTSRTKPTAAEPGPPVRQRSAHPRTASTGSRRSSGPTGPTSAPSASTGSTCSRSTSTPTRTGSARRSAGGSS